MGQKQLSVYFDLFSLGKKGCTILFTVFRGKRHYSMRDLTWDKNNCLPVLVPSAWERKDALYQLRYSSYTIFLSVIDTDVQLPTSCDFKTHGIQIHCSD